MCSNHNERRNRTRHCLRWLLPGLLLAALLLPAVHTFAQQSPPDMATYEGWLREALVAARRSDRLGLEQVAASLTSTEHVRAADGSNIPVDNRWLSEALQSPDPDFAQIAARLGALVDAVDQPPPSAPDDAQQRLREILSRPPFATEERRQASWLSRLLDWLLDWLERLFNPAARAGASTGSLFNWLIVAVFSVLLLAVLIYLFLNVRRALSSEAQAAPAHDPEANLTASTALQQASTLARGGDYRTAVRYLYLSSLLWLDERGLLRYDRALTNREYLEHLRDNPELQARLTPIVDTFDRVWYGHVTLDAEGFQVYQQQVEALRKPAR